MRIELETRNTSGHSALCVGTRSRLATCTSVALLGRNRMIVGSLVGQSLYLIQFDRERNQHQVLDRITTTFAAEAVCTDLISYDGQGTVATSNCRHGTVTLYRVGPARIEHLRDLPLQGPDGGFCHGVSFVPGGELLCVALQSGKRVFQLYTRDGGFVTEFGGGEMNPKDAVFIDAHTMLAMSSRGRASTTGSTASGSRIARIGFSQDYSRALVEDVLELPAPQLDCITFAAGRAYVTDQANDRVLGFGLGHEPAWTCALSGFSFPHGIDASAESGLLAVTNYGYNSIDVCPLPPAPPG